MSYVESYVSVLCLMLLSYVLCQCLMCYVIVLCRVLCVMSVFYVSVLTCKRGSVGQSEGLLIPRSSVRFRLKPEMTMCISTGKTQTTP